MRKLSALVVACSFALLPAACKKKDDAAKAEEHAAKADKTADKAADKPDDKVPGKLGDPKPADPAAGASGGGVPAPNGGAKQFNNFDEYDAANVAGAADAVKIFSTDGANCKNLAADITTYAQANKDTLAAIKAFENANPGADQRSQERHPDKAQDVSDKTTPGITACKDDPAFKAAMALVQ